jgi:hypothetical protein
MSSYSAIVNPRDIQYQQYSIRTNIPTAIKNDNLGYHPTGLERYEKSLQSKSVSKLSEMKSVGAWHPANGIQVGIPIPSSASDNQRRNYNQIVTSEQPRERIPASNPFAPRSISGTSAGAVNREKELVRDIRLSKMAEKIQSERTPQIRPIIEPQLLRV